MAMHISWSLSAVTNDDSLWNKQEWHGRFCDLPTSTNWWISNWWRLHRFLHIQTVLVERWVDQSAIACTPNTCPMWLIAMDSLEINNYTVSAIYAFMLIMRPDEPVKPSECSHWSAMLNSDGPRPFPGYTRIARVMNYSQEPFANRDGCGSKSPVPQARFWETSR